MTSKDLAGVVDMAADMEDMADTDIPPILPGTPRITASMVMAILGITMIGAIGAMVTAGTAMIGRHAKADGATVVDGVTVAVDSPIAVADTTAVVILSRTQAAMTAAAIITAS